MEYCSGGDLFSVVSQKGRVGGDGGEGYYKTTQSVLSGISIPEGSPIETSNWRTFC